jgi:hypothetical protein
MNGQFDISKQQDNIAVHAQAEQRKELKHLGTLKRQKGQVIFEANIETGDIEPATFTQEAIGVNGKVFRKLIVKPNCTYLAALNKANAVRKVNAKLASVL